MNIIGIDPGASGGIAVVQDGFITEAYKMPATERDVHDLLEPYCQFGVGSPVRLKAYL